MINSKLMRGVLFLILIFELAICNAQEYANFIVQSDDSVRFVLELDGVRQLDSAYYNIKVEGLEDQSHDVRLILASSDSQVIEKALFFQSMGVESTMKLVNLNGEYKLRYFGEVSMGAAPIQENQCVVQYKGGTESLLLINQIYQK